jgi:hypothetical protein
LPGFSQQRFRGLGRIDSSLFFAPDGNSDFAWSDGRQQPVNFPLADNACAVAPLLMTPNASPKSLSLVTRWKPRGTAAPLNL